VPRSPLKLRGLIFPCCPGMSPWYDSGLSRCATGTGDARLWNLSSPHGRGYVGQPHLDAQDRGGWQCSQDLNEARSILGRMCIYGAMSSQHEPRRPSCTIRPESQPSWLHRPARRTEHLASCDVTGDEERARLPGWSRHLRGAGSWRSYRLDMAVLTHGACYGAMQASSRLSWLHSTFDICVKGGLVASVRASS